VLAAAHTQGYGDVLLLLMGPAMYCHSAGAAKVAPHACNVPNERAIWSGKKSNHTSAPYSSSTATNRARPAKAQQRKGKSSPSLPKCGGTYRGYNAIDAIIIIYYKYTQSSAAEYSDQNDTEIKRYYIRRIFINLPFELQRRS
jgi:hypothetical protein